MLKAHWYATFADVLLLKVVLRAVTGETVARLCGVPPFCSSCSVVLHAQPGLFVALPVLAALPLERRSQCFLLKTGMSEKAL